MMDSKTFGILLLFVICSAFVRGSPVGTNSNGEIPNPDALTTTLPLKNPNIQTPKTLAQEKSLSNATEIQSRNSSINNEKPSILPTETISTENGTLNVKPKLNDTTVPVNVKPVEPAVHEPAIAEETTTISTRTAKTAIISTTTAAPANTTANSTANTTGNTTGNTTASTTASTTTSTTTTAAATTVTISPTTPSPVTTPASAVSPTSVKSEEMENDRGFDGPSFIGGIVLAFGLTGIGFVAYKFYKSRMDMSYRHF